MAKKADNEVTITIILDHGYNKDILEEVFSDIKNWFIERIEDKDSEYGVDGVFIRFNGIMSTGKGRSKKLKNSYLFSVKTTSNS